MRKSSMVQNFGVKMIGHLKATEVETGTVLANDWNAVHPENMARAFARALANEPNCGIYRMALGNGGTTISAGGTITYNTPNDGQSPDPSGWQSRLYNETYSEVIDQNSPNFGTGPGDVPADDARTDTSPFGPGVNSQEDGLISLVYVDVTLNASEPTGQDQTDGSDPSTDSEYYFDEFGIYTTGLPPTNTVGQQTVNLLNKTVNDNTGLAASHQYAFAISINGGIAQTVTITTPATGSGILGGSNFVNYADLIGLLNTALNPLGANASITDLSNNIETNGNLIISTIATGPNATIAIQTTSLPTNWLFNELIGYESLATPVAGVLAGVQNDLANPSAERERLLAHVIFSPILKAANRTINIQYTLSIAVARTVQAPST